MSNHKLSSKRRRCKTQDINRFTWCTSKNFLCLYDGIYTAMVEAGIAEKLEEKIMYDRHGEITINKNELYVQPSKYKIKHLDETGANTNMKDDWYAGSQMCVLPLDLGFHGGRNGSITDLHFTVLCFTITIGIPVLNTLLLKSLKEIQDKPLNWKQGIDICKEIVTGESTVENFEQN
jgi:hypothetical protein